MGTYIQWEVAGIHAGVGARAAEESRGLVRSDRSRNFGSLSSTPTSQIVKDELYKSHPLQGHQQYVAAALATQQREQHCVRSISDLPRRMGENEKSI